jgi:hypothetical protein
MKYFGMLKLPMMFVGLGAALALSPACKAQEVSPDHFTDTGVQNVYESASAKTAAPKPKQHQPAAQVRSSKANSSATLQPVAKRTPVSAAQPGPKTVADKHKSAPATPKKQ